MAVARLETHDVDTSTEAKPVMRQADQANPSLDLAFVLAENLIAQNKMDGKDQAAGYIAAFGTPGWAERSRPIPGSTDPLPARKTMGQGDCQDRGWLGRSWDRCPGLHVQLDLMLAECYSRVGAEEQRLDILRRAAEGAGLTNSPRSNSSGCGQSRQAPRGC